MFLIIFVSIKMEKYIYRLNKVLQYWESSQYNSNQTNMYLNSTRQKSLKEKYIDFFLKRSFEQNLVVSLERSLEQNLVVSLIINTIKTCNKTYLLSAVANNSKTNITVVDYCDHKTYNNWIA